MIILLALLIFIFLLLIFSVRIVFEIKLENFVFSAKLTLKLPFSKEIYNSRRAEGKKREKQESEKKGRKMDLDTLKKLKAPVVCVITELCKILKRHCRILRVDIAAKSALEDPMENGIAFGIVSGVVNVVALVLKEKCRAKKVNLENISDFDSGEGLIFSGCGTINIRPVPLAINLILNRKIIKETKNILEILKREDNENG